MENYKHEMTDLNNTIITHCNSFVGEIVDLEYLEAFIGDGVNKRLFELVESTCLYEALSEKDFNYLMHNIDNLKSLLRIIIHEATKDR
jgi:hypothetical protein